jgi:ribosome-binding factor A
MSNRAQRVAGVMKRELAQLLARRLRDPRLTGLVSVTDVEVSNDLSVAKVYVSILETGETREQTLRALESASGFVRSELAHALGLREVPEIRFKFDDSIERGSRVEELLRKIERGEPVGDEEEA